jgi:F0F1-type ATP synthase membrane subunit c/vacuolar-type H+-ATPase subunit K
MTMRFQRLLRAALLAVALAVTGAAIFGGCASNSGLVNMWRDPAYKEPPMQKMLVVAIIQNSANRRILEDAFGKQLAKRGVDAVPSYSRFPDAPPDTMQILDAVGQGNYDGVLVATRLRPERTTSYVPGYVTTQPAYRVSPWSGRYRTYWVDVMHPGYVEENITVRHNVELWSMREQGNLVWSAVGETVNPSAPTEVTHDIAHNVVPELERQGFIPRKR